jgi:nucleotide-binding universal stress UspA family protein
MMQEEAGQSRPIVVGVDGSAHSRLALAWAAGQAELTGSVLEVVTAWQIPTVFGGYSWAPVVAAESADYEELAAKTANEAIADTIDPASPVRVNTTIVQGFPAQVLLDAARHASLLVVGSRGHGAFSGALLGSVSQHCAHHAPCPIVIVGG